MAGPRILAFAGSTRSASFNRALLRLAVQAARRAGGDVTEIDLREFPLPLYDGDLEAREGLPGPARRLRDLFKEHAGLLVASPEYNSSISGVLKNVIDWVSRPQPGEPPLACFRGKVAALLSASTGALGGVRGLAALRLILGNIKVLVLPDQVTVAQADQAFAPDGALRDPKRQEAVERLA
ncbi:MAG: NADPH-dependent FMN reductase, partial [Planctomycetota bacterium]